MSRHSRGFTVIELMIALAIAALCLGIAVPAFGNAVSASHAGAARTDLGMTLLAGIRESMIANAHVVVCASPSGHDCNGGTDWSEGWIAFADLDEDRSRDAGETLLKHHGPLADGVHLRSTAGRTRIVLQPQGGAAAGSNVTFTLCDSRGPAKAVSLVLANSGRLRSGRPTPAAARACAGQA